MAVCLYNESASVEASFSTVSFASTGSEAILRRDGDEGEKGGLGSGVKCLLKWRASYVFLYLGPITQGYISGIDT